MLILMTGDRGFIGTETKKLLEENGHDVIGYDLMDGKDIRKEIQSKIPDRILHLAAIARFSDADKNPKLAFETNVLGTVNVVNFARLHSIPLVYSSTGSVYMPIHETPPITEKFVTSGNSQYGCSKLIGEKYVQEHTPHIILRYAHVYGREKREHGLIGGYWDRIKRGLKPILYGGTQSNDFVYVYDVAQANLKALEAPFDKWNEIYNIGTGEEIIVEKAGELICEATGWSGGIEKTKEKREVDPNRFVYDISKAEIKLGYKVEWDFEKGLKDMFK